MMKNVKWSTLALAMGAMAMSSATFAAPPSAEMLSYSCAGCHGTNGSSAGPSMPSLAGQDKKVLVDSMKGFKSGDRPSSVMGRLAKGYSDADFEAMGDFFSKQKRAASGVKLDAAKIKKGAAVAEKYCSRCHIEDGKEGKDGASIVAGQWLKYLQIQNDDYLSGKRKMVEKMEEKVKQLPNAKEDMDAAAYFYASKK
jgi:cytochrome subunit of sulfide dehydrogenase